MKRGLRVILELGRKRRVVAGATDWPGLDRWGTTEPEAVERLLSYLPRYAGVAERAGLAGDLPSSPVVEIIERVPGNSSTDFWGIAHVPSQAEFAAISEADLERRLALLRACWTTFDDVAGRVSAELARGPRGGGRDRDEIIDHVYGSERYNWSPKVEVRTEPGVMLTAEGLETHRRQFVEAIRAYHADGRLARRWPLPYLIRRTAQHVMDHAWELEDKDLTVA